MQVKLISSLKTVSQGRPGDWTSTHRQYVDS